MVEDEYGRLEWEFDFHTASIPFNPTMLEMEFENKVEIKRFYDRHASSPDFRYMPKGEYSKTIEIQFIKIQITPFKTNLVIVFLAEKPRPVFKKIVWTNKSQGQEHILTKDQIKQLNQFP